MTRHKDCQREGSNTVLTDATTVIQHNMHPVEERLLKRYIYCAVPMFAYGVYRQYTATMRPPMDLIGYRTILSVTNGLVYASPFGLFSLLRLVNRTDVWATGKDATLYKDCYEETFGYNGSTV